VIRGALRIVASCALLLAPAAASAAAALETPPPLPAAPGTLATIDLFQRLGLAAAIGLIIGIERGWRERDSAPGSRTAGLRTYTLIGLFGGIWAALVPLIGPWPLAIAGLGFGAAFAAFRYRECVADNDFSVTSVVVAMLTYALGALAVLGDMAAAGAAGAFVTGLLAARHTLHGFLRTLTWPELRSGVLLLAMTFLLLPVLPDRTVDPWDALNPYKLWLAVVLIAALSFVGYAAVRVMGETRGLLAASAAGALVSSTAVTLNNARLAAKAQGGHGVLAAGITIAWIISLARVTVLATIVNRALLVPLGMPMLAAIAVLLAVTVIELLRGGTAKSVGLKLQNPFELMTVIGFGLLLAGVLLASKILTDIFGEAGLLPFAAISGTMDVDPITLSAAQLAGNSVTVGFATLAILIASGANLTTKIATAVGIGGVRFGAQLAAAGVLAAVAAGVTWALFGGTNGV
jgi:uncharacterized membrane protein (DUF4010 family)